MKIKKKICVLSLILLITMAFVGCSSSKEIPPAAQQQIELNISAAVSLKDALNEIKNSYQVNNPNVKLVYNLGASGSLQKQIEQGAPADIFISAAPKQMNDLADKKLIKNETRRNLVENKLVVVVPKDSKIAIEKFEDLTQGGIQKIALGETNTVPAGQYSEQVLQKLGIWEKVKEKAVFAKDARTVLTYTETSNVEAGIVYKTDAASSAKVKIAVMAPEGSHQPIVYPIAVLAGTRHQKAADEFIAYLFGSESKAIFEKNGFTMGK